MIDELLLKEQENIVSIAGPHFDVKELCDLGEKVCVKNPDNNSNIPRQVCTVCWKLWLVNIVDTKPVKKDNDMCHCNLGCAC